MGIHYQRKLYQLEKDLVLFDSQVNVEGTVKLGDITGNFYRLIFVEMISGECYWSQDSKRIVPTQKKFAIYIPPFSITEDVHLDHKFNCKMFLGRSYQTTVHTNPILFYPPINRFPTSSKEVEEFLSNHIEGKNIATKLQAEPQACKIKKMIEQGFREEVLISDIAKELKISNGRISQLFKKSFGITPVQYRRGLRVEEAVFKLLTGIAPAEVAFEVGYQDLGRFYKQFKSVIHEAPAKFQKNLI